MTVLSLLLLAASPTLRGIDPAHYQERRKPVPEVGRELVQQHLTADQLIALYRDASADKSSAEATRALREGALVGLGHDASPTAVRFLVAVLVGGEPDEGLRATAARELGRTGSGEAVSALVTSVEQDLSERVRAAALNGLARVGGEAAASKLSKVASQENASAALRRAAIIGLGWLAATTTSEAQRAQVGERLVDAFLRRPEHGLDALEALSMFDAVEARARLARAAKDEHLGADTRARAAHADERLSLAMKRRALRRAPGVKTR